MTTTRAPKAAMLVAQRILRDAMRAGLSPGDLLPSERGMLEQYETGRGTLREALRLLEFQGVITLKPGPGGGPVLTSPTASNLANTLMLLMQLNHAQYRTIVEVRNAVEPMIGKLAAQHITDAQLDQLAGTIESMRCSLDDRELFLEENKKFHDIIAWSSGNVLFACLVESLLGILDGTAIGIDYPSHRRSAILKAHEEIYQALAKRDAASSEERMREHVEAYTRYAMKKFPHVLDQAITWNHLLG
ncbi:GntR family transcriptional regulator [Microbispora rosea subsp. aerata]|nr:FCD domain-containing protein [Microbispora rosea]GGO20496.1 GntR family transcriptional regulator [Microbispora rosea subsp. aerata]GIH57152.1 GntR family transcriptional regulator [Microbispora rosea subsp. aerata]GLJ84778.1 GntR family transcriptional regulator [Microbispora rosea subsp. aerata]